MYRWLLLGALCTSGCLPSPGPCDEPSALEIVYTADGTPSFAGQAVMQASCGNGGFCHSEPDVPSEDRFGAPVDLGFDVRLASTSRAAQVEQADRLLRHAGRALNMRREVLHQVEVGQMPPQGEAGREYLCQVTPSACGSTGEDLVYDRFADDGVTATPLPTLLDPEPGRRDEAQEILRNWLSCRTPVVERTLDREDRGDNLRGFTVPACERTCVDVRWPAIYERVIVPSCSSSSCHDADDPQAGLDLATGGADGVHSRIVATPRLAEGAQCEATSLVTIVPMMPDDSLLLNKLEAASSDDVCGSRMPLSGNPLSPQRLCIIRAWIECGACPEADGGACAACLDAARADCNFDPASAAGCASAEPCPNRFDL